MVHSEEVTHRLGPIHHQRLAAPLPAGAWDGHRRLRIWAWSSSRWCLACSLGCRLLAPAQRPDRCRNIDRRLIRFDSACTVDSHMVAVSAPCNHEGERVMRLQESITDHGLWTRCG